MGDELIRMRPGRHRSQCRHQCCRIAVAVVGPDRCLIGGQTECHRNLPARLSQVENLGCLPCPGPGMARQAQAFKCGAALQQLRSRIRPGAHHLEVGQRGIHRCGVYPAAGSRSLHSLLQLHQAEQVQPGVGTRIVFEIEVGRSQHLRQQVGCLSDAGHLFLAKVGGDAVGMTRVGQGRRGEGGRGGGCVLRHEQGRWRATSRGCTPVPIIAHDRPFHGIFLFDVLRHLAPACGHAGQPAALGLHVHDADPGGHLAAGLGRS